MKTRKHDAIILSSQNEKIFFAQLVSHLKNTPVPNDEILDNLGLFLTSKNLARILFFYEIYKKILHHHGLIVEFGVRWGQTLAIMSILRSIFEPFNRHRKIIGFDTFAGLKGMCKKDGKVSKCKDKSFSVPLHYENLLEEILSIQEKLNPMPHLKRFEIIKGDAAKTVPMYFRKHPETIISLAIFDFDIYAPTKVALRTIKPNLAKGGILVFDELCDEIFPGETIALKEEFGLRHVKTHRFPMACRLSYLEIK